MVLVMFGPFVTIMLCSMMMITIKTTTTTTTMMKTTTKTTMTMCGWTSGTLEGEPGACQRMMNHTTRGVRNRATKHST